MYPGSVQPGCSLAALTLNLSHSERGSLILNEGLTCRLSSSSSVSRKDTRPESPSTGGIKLAPPVRAFTCKTVLVHAWKGRGEAV
jgi:hypothetical protein